MDNAARKLIEAQIEMLEQQEKGETKNITEFRSRISAHEYGRAELRKQIDELTAAWPS